jgi:hypothetical protein
MALQNDKKLLNRSFHQIVRLILININWLLNGLGKDFSLGCAMLPKCCCVFAGSAKYHFLDTYWLTFCGNHG